MMKSGKTLVALIILFTSIMFGSSAYAQSGSWKVSESQGDVSISHQGVTKVAVKGAALSAGDSIKTGANGRAVITRDEQYVVVSRNSHIKVAPQKTKSLLTQFVQYFGNALFKVDKRKDQHFAVETPYMAAVVKGTTFNVSVGAEGATVQVTEGAVEVATLDGGARELLLPGDIGLVERGDPFSLGIRGRNSRSIESRNKPAGQAAPAVKAEPVVAAVAAPAITPAITEAVPSGPAIKEIRVASVDLAGLTDGLIEGNSPSIIVEENEDVSSSDVQDNSDADQALFNAVTAVNTDADIADGNASSDESADNGNNGRNDHDGDGDGKNSRDNRDNDDDDDNGNNGRNDRDGDGDGNNGRDDRNDRDDDDDDRNDRDDDDDDRNDRDDDDDDRNDRDDDEDDRNDRDDDDDDRNDRDDDDDDRNDRDDDDDDRGGRRCRTLACAVIRGIID